MHKGFKISIVDKMPPPSDLGVGGRRKSYSQDEEGGDGDVGEFGDGESDGGDRDAQLSAVADFFAAGKKGDNEAALSALTDLMEMCARG